jgi:hypothetical protein
MKSVRKNRSQETLSESFRHCAERTPSCHDHRVVAGRVEEISVRPFQVDGRHASRIQTRV